MIGLSTGKTSSLTTLSKANKKRGADTPLIVFLIYKVVKPASFLEIRSKFFVSFKALNECPFSMVDAKSTPETSLFVNKVFRTRVSLSTALVRFAQISVDS